MEKLGIILKDTLKKSGFEKKLMQFQIFLNYENLVGENISKVSKPVFFRNDTIFIGVENPIWSHQLHFLKKQIIEKLNSIFNEPIVRDIKFQICSFEASSSNTKTGIKKETTVELPDKTVKMIYNISSEIQDQELRRKFSELMVKDFKYKMKKEEVRCSSI